MFKNLIPWQKKESEHPMVAFRERMDRVFEDFFRDFQEMIPWQGSMPGIFDRSDFTPKIDVAETEKEIHINAELPGMTEKDIEVALENNVLTLKGEKKHEEEKQDKNYHYVERRYGSFYRSVPLSQEVDVEKISATFRNGVLQVVIPKKESAVRSTKIPIQK